MLVKTSRPDCKSSKSSTFDPATILIPSIGFNKLGQVVYRT